MTAFRIWMLIQFTAITAYTIPVGLEHGWDLVPVFLSDILRMNWPGQFNFDFLGFLVLSGMWVAWRSRFSPGGIVLGIVATFGGILFLSAYLFVCSFFDRSFADLLLGRQRLAIEMQ